MVRISKQEEHRHKSPRKNKKAAPKTGPRKDTLSGYKNRVNALEGKLSAAMFIGKIK